MDSKREIYFDLFHTDEKAACFHWEFCPEWQRVAENIRTLLEQGANVHFTPHGRIDDNLPQVPLDAKITVGGAVLDCCVWIRADFLRELGFTNVEVD